MPCVLYVSFRKAWNLFAGKRTHGGTHKINSMDFFRGKHCLALPPPDRTTHIALFAPKKCNIEPKKRGLSPITHGLPWFRSKDLQSVRLVSGSYYWIPPLYFARTFGSWFLHLSARREKFFFRSYKIDFYLLRSLWYK